MKHKCCISTFLILAQIGFVFGQDFAPIGAKWYYTERFAFSGDISYLSIESVGDTLIKGRKCKVLANNGGLYCAFHNEKDYVFYEDSVAYFYVPEIDSFQILYDLRAKQNNSWIVVFKIDQQQKLDTIQVVVDSVDYITINSNKLKRFFVSYKSLNNGYEDWGYGGEIIERIGNKNYLFQLYSLSGLFCDGNYSDGLRCYSDTVLGFYSTGIADSCTYIYNWTGIEIDNTNPEYELYPNPASDWIIIKSAINKELTYNLLDLSGKALINSVFYGSLKIDLTPFQNGYYILIIKTSDKILGVEKILKK